MFRINKLSKKIIVYSVSLVLITTLIFTTISISTLIMFKKYTVKKTESTFKKNANMNLEKEVVLYAKNLKNVMDSRKSVTYMFGKILDRNINPFLGCNEQVNLAAAYGEINESLDIRAIVILDSKFNIKCQFPKFVPARSTVNLIKKTLMLKKESSKKVQYIDFHVNEDGGVSYSYVYLTKDKNNNPVFIVFDFNPYSIYSLIKTAQLSPYSQKYLWVINKKGILIFDPPTKKHSLITLLDNVDLTDKQNGEALSEIVKNEILKGKTGSSRYIFRGVDKFVGYTYIDEFGWGLGLTLPTESLYAPIINLSRDIDSKTIQTLSILSIINAIVIIGSVFIAMFLAKKITRPISQVIDAIDAIIKGDRSVRLHTGGNDELEELASSVNKLMDFFDKIWDKIKKNRGD